VNMQSFGDGDDEKRVCGDAFKTDDCVIISIGSMNQFGFEEAVFDRTKCRVEVFDCFNPVKKRTYKKPSISELLRIREKFRNVSVHEFDCMSCVLGCETKGK
jgi:hypothetical protein